MVVTDRTRFISINKKTFLTARSRILNSFLQMYGILKADQLKEVQIDESSEKGYKRWIQNFDGRVCWKVVS
jgi:hypothetical protein